MSAEMIHRGRHYEACVLGDDLVVTRRSRYGGIKLPKETAAEWIESIRTAVDKQEAEALCRAILRT